MKRYMLIALVALALVAPASAQSGYSNPGPISSFVLIHNDTDTMVWITTYRAAVGGDHITGSWAVQPHSSSDHGLTTLVTNVRAEINAGSCSGANKLDEQLGTHLRDKKDGVTNYALTGYVRFTGGKCTFKTD